MIYQIRDHFADLGGQKITQQQPTLGKGVNVGVTRYKTLNACMDLNPREPYNLADSVESMLQSEIRATQLKHGHANVMYECLAEQVTDFQKTLEQDEEVGAYLSSFGQTVEVQIEDIGYHNPHLIIFYGRDTKNGNRVQLVQHTSQINVLFVALKVKENRPANRIGFQTDA